MPTDYGPTPKLREVDFGAFGPIPRVERVKRLPLQLGKEYRTLLHASITASQVAGRQVQKLAAEHGFKGLEVAKLRKLVEDQAAIDIVRLLREQWRDMGIHSAPIEGDFGDWYDMYKEAEGLPPERGI